MKPYKIGYTCGVYDLFHVGHLNLLEKCKEYCDYLIVGVCDDEYVRLNKQCDPVISENDRLRIIKSLKVVDDAYLIDNTTTNDKMLAFQKFHFDVLFSGSDWKGSDRYLKTEAEFAPLGVSIEYFPYTEGVSTTDLKHKIQSTKKVN